MARQEEICMHLGEVEVGATLGVPKGSVGGIVIFAHGSGSSRKSPRNRSVAKVLQEGGLATLLLDLLAPAEAEARHKVFDIGLLTDRLVMATNWLETQGEMAAWPVGLFGASTGAAAALRAAAQIPERIKAVVSRGGRPDLAMEILPQVQTPTLLLVGGHDEGVIQLNRQAYGYLNVAKEFVVIPRATHLFEEPGALEEVADLARDWFVRYLFRASRRSIFEKQLDNLRLNP